jgi:hypothetical protein
MIKRDGHGGVLPTSIPSFESKSVEQEFMANNTIYEAEIEKVYAVDDPDNKFQSANFTVCDIILRKANGSSEPVKNCRLMQPAWGGTPNNFLETLQVDPGPSASSAKNPRSQKRSNYVLVAFINGRKDYGVILGGLPHANPVARKRRPSKKKGVYLEAEFQGLNWKINNDGSMEMIFNGPRNDKGEIVGKDGPTTVKIDPKGNFQISTNNQQTFSIDREKQTVSVDCGPTKFVMDGKADKITAKSKTVETLGSATNRVHGDKVKISKSPTSEPTEPFVLGNVFVQMMQKLITAISNHQHIGNLGVPTPPPINKAEFESLKSSPIADKKILSDFITGEKG